MGTTVTIENGRPVGYLSSAEYAEKCGVAYATIRVWCGRNKIDRTLKIGSDWWIPEDVGRPTRKRRAK